MSKRSGSALARFCYHICNFFNTCVLFVFDDAVEIMNSPTSIMKVLFIDVIYKNIKFKSQLCSGLINLKQEKQTLKKL